MRFFANFFSWFFHPMLIPTIGFGIFILANPYFFSAYAPRDISFELLRVFLLTFFFPAFTVMLLVQLKFVSNYELPKREERIIPFIATGFFYIWTFYVYYNVGAYSAYQAILLGASISIFLGLLINVLFFKISAHASGVGGLVAFVMILLPIAQLNMTPIFLLSILAAGLVGTSRLYLKAHTGREVLSGYFLGYFSQWLAFMITGF